MVEIRIAHTSSTVDAAKPLQQLRNIPHAKNASRPLQKSLQGALQGGVSGSPPPECLPRTSSAECMVDKSLEAEGLGSCFRNLSADVSHTRQGVTTTATVPREASSRRIHDCPSALGSCSCNHNPSVMDAEPWGFPKLPPPDEAAKVLPREVAFGFVTFLFCGIASLVCWQSLLGMLPYIEQHAYGGAPYGNSVLGIYQLGCIAVQVAFILFIDAMKPGMLVAAIVLDAALALLLPLVLSRCTHTLSIALFHCIALGFGVCAGVVSGGAIALASSVPFGFIGSFSMGQGVCGIVAFVVNLVASRYLFDLATSEGAKSMFWLVFGASAAVSVFSAVLLVVSLRQPWARREEARETPRERRWGVWSLTCACGSRAGGAPSLGGPPADAETPWRRFLRRWRGTHAAAAEVAAAVHAAGDARTQALVVIGGEGCTAREGGGSCDGASRGSCMHSSGSSLWRLYPPPDAPLAERAQTTEVDESVLPSRGWRCILSACWVYLLCVFFTFVVSLNLYPRVGPMSWNYGGGFSAANEQYIILFGVFCVFDFVGKALPDLARHSRLQWLRLSKRSLVSLVLSRALLGVFFILGMLCRNHPFLNAFPWYVCLVGALALTSGCCATASISGACNSVTRFEEKEIVGPAAVLMLLLGIACGVYSAYIY
ncbi:hypothetical protein cyc_01083 [Cyclospora cayetanensis]|uniref:Nucleoside transporter protein n=1 Tax=Cyclospora cayetanensis TaxID=88456 RepID=A0A1D3D3B1_9EIME|nr:hypothetical protein cyc_01083 [Cyclospora cayetanensis]